MNYKHSLYRINLTQLDYFMSAARYRNLARAAKECHVMPTVISRQISKIEKTIGVKLFDRSARHLELTEAGTIFYSYALDMQARFDHLLSELSVHEESINIKLKIGYYDAWSASCLTQAVSAFTFYYPDADISLGYVNISNIRTDLENRYFDMVVTALPDQTADMPDHMLIAESPICLVVSRNHPLHDRKSIRFDQIDDRYLSILALPSFVAGKKDAGEADHVSSFINRFDAIGLTQSTDIYNIMLGIRAGNNIGLMPEAFKKISGDDLVFIPIEDSDRTVSCYILYDKDNPNEACRQFLDIAGPLFGSL